MTRNVTCAPNVLEVSDKGRTVLLSLDDGRYFGLNEVARIVWEGLRRGRSPELIAPEIAARYGVSESAVLDDVYGLLADLVRERLAEEDHAVQGKLHREERK